MQYSLDMETALVLASAVQIQVPNSASVEGGGNCVVTVEHMQKISATHVAVLSVSMALESHKRASSEEAYWIPESAKKLRFLPSKGGGCVH